MARFVSVIVTTPVYVFADRPSFGLMVNVVVEPDPSVVFNPVLTRVKFGAPDVSVTSKLLIAPVPVFVIVKLVAVIGAYAAVAPGNVCVPPLAITGLVTLTAYECPTVKLMLNV